LLLCKLLILRSLSAKGCDLPIGPNGTGLPVLLTQTLAYLATRAPELCAGWSAEIVLLQRLAFSASVSAAQLPVLPFGAEGPAKCDMAIEDADALPTIIYG
jgi:hypothetical protein